MKKHINLNIELLYMFATMFDLVFFGQSKNLQTFYLTK
jgi:hypothetical protein